jgi:O-antigen/teichoic acid export membrane protein
MTISIQRLKRNVISNALGTIAPAVAWFLIVPILVAQLGEQGFGVYTIAISFAGVLGFLELGLTSAATKFIAEVNIRSNRRKLGKIISNNLSIYIGLGIIITTLGFVFAPEIGPMMFHGSGLEQNEMERMVQLISIILSITLIKNTFSSILMGLHRYDLYNAIQICYAVVLAIVQAGIVLNKGTIIALLAGNIALTAICLIAFIAVVQKLIPGVRMLRWPDGYFFRLLFSFGMYMMIINFAGTLLFNIDKVLIGQILGPKSVSYYAIPTQMTLKVHNALAVFVSFLFPMVSEVQSSGDKTTIKNIFLQGMRFMMLIDGLVMVFLAVFSQQIMHIWISADFAAQSALLLQITAIGYIFYSLSITPYHILLGMGRPKVLAILNLVTTLSVIGGLFAGLTWFGLVGGCVGALFGFVTAAIMPIYLQRVLGISWSTVFKQSYGRTILCTVSASFLSIFLPQSIAIRLLFFAIFILVLIFFGNARIEDWQFFQNQWQRITAQIVVLRNKNVHRN